MKFRSHTGHTSHTLDRKNQAARQGTPPEPDVSNATSDALGGLFAPKLAAAIRTIAATFPDARLEWLCPRTLETGTQAAAPRPAPDSRHPPISPEVRAKIEAIEDEARRAGWPHELLWNAGFWDLPRGLAAVLEADDEIAEVTADAIKILKMRGELQTFRRQPA